MKNFISIVSVLAMTLVTTTSAYAAHPMCKPVQIIIEILCG